MYPIEHYMKTLKKYVLNMTQIERSVEKSHNYDECLSFVTKYLQRFQAVKIEI
jgi:hypothetical protein